jgi:hypothetical protein
VVAWRMVTLVSFSKSWSALCRKCLYNGKLVFFLLFALCSFILVLRGLDVWPTYWLPLVHLVHSIR